MQKHFTQADIKALDKRYRVHFINCLSGFKSANLVGTRNKAGVPNLAIVSSVFHLGADPALMGMVIRPNSVPRDTLTNIQEIGVYTLNHVNSKIYQKAHQTSARYTPEQNEFNEVGLTEHYITGFDAPFVAESHVTIGLRAKEIMPLAINNTLLVIGEIEHVFVPTNALLNDGFVDIEKLDSVTVSGLDSYHQTNRLGRLSYAKVGKAVSFLPINLENEQ
jgi:flavin reductase (DIM6/NTAB) family NADH-FMN oxidoreductase RutF